MTVWGLIIDLVIVGYLCLNCFLGWRRGFLWQAVGLASVAFGILLGLAAAPGLSGRVMQNISSDSFRANTIAFLFVFGLVCVLLRLLAAWAVVTAEKGIPKEVREKRRARDRVLGSAFGALKGLVFAAIVTAACVTFYPQCPLWHESRLAAALSSAGGRLLPDGAVQDAGHWARSRFVHLKRNLDIQ